MNTFPFHSDELVAQQKAGVVMSGAGIRAFMPDQHRLFFAGLRYVFVAAVGADGWPVATVLTGAPGFISSPDPQTLQIAIPATASVFAEGQEVGLLGLDLATRRRNRANGRVTQYSSTDGMALLTIAIDQSFGNCPQYIHRRTVHPVEDSGDGGDGNPATIEIERFSQMDTAARALIARADTFFVASHSRAGGPAGGADISHRGGRPGFIHIDGDDLWIPDFHGNNFFNTLGNLLGEPRAELLFIDFEHGDVLHLQGEVEIQWRPEAMRHFAGAERFWRFRVQRGWRQAAALPLRWSYIDAAPTTAMTGTWAEAAQAAMTQPTNPGPH
jgi:predicted pyridoxine 5'-phosphate oxidase superfamily flavin-nucleotide-binding protein